MISRMSRLFPGLAVAAALLAVAAPAAHAGVATQYFKMPAGADRAGSGLAVAPDGTVFFGADNYFSEAPPIGRLDPAQAAPGTANGMTTVNTTDNPAISGSAIFRDFSFSAKDQALYWTRSDNTVGKLVGNTATRVNVPVAPWGIVAAPDGGAWMTEYGTGAQTPNPADRAGSRIARVGSGLGLSELPNLQSYSGTYIDSRFDAQPRGITVAADGSPWFAEASPGNPGYRIGHVSGANSYVEYSAPCGAGSPCSGSNTGTGLTDVAVDPSGAIWYTNELKRVITKMIPGVTQTEYPLSGLGGVALGAGTPRSIATGADGYIWAAVSGGYASPGANAILRINPTSLATTVYVLGAANQPYTIAPDTARGNVWFTGSEGTGGTSLGRLAGVDGVVDPGPGPSPGGAGGGDGGGDTTTPIVTPVVAPPTPTVTTTLQPGQTATASVSNPVVSGDSISANQICVGPPQDRCSLVYLIQTHEYVTGFPGTHGYMAKAKKLTTIGTLKVTLKGGQKKKVTIKLNSKGRKLRKKMAFKATLTVTQSVNGAKPKQILKKNLKFKK